MPVEKYVVSHEEESGFTKLPNKVLQGLKNAEALGLWCYLASLPPSWTFYKTEIRSHFKMGRDKLEKLLLLLKKSNLIIVTQIRGDDGQFNDWNLKIMSGKNFGEIGQICVISPFTDFQGTVQTQVKRDLAPFPDLPFTVNQSLVNSTYKEIQIKKQKTKKREPLSPNFEIEEKTHEYVRKLGLKDETIQLEHHKFYNHFLANGEKCLNWNFRYRKWMNNAVEYLRNRRK